MEGKPITPETADAVRHELEQLARSREPGGPNGLLAIARIRKLLGEDASRLVLGRNMRLRERGQGPLSDEDIQILVDAAADLEAMTPRRPDHDG